MIVWVPVHLGCLCLEWFAFETVIFIQMLRSAVTWSGDVVLGDAAGRLTTEVVVGL